MRFAAAPRVQQRRLAAALEGLKLNPLRPGDLQEKDAQGRSNEILLADDWLITYWLDHAVREVRVLRLERVED